MVWNLQNTSSFPNNLLITKWTKIPLFDANDFGTSIYNAIQTISIMDRQTAEPTSERKCQKTLNKRLVKTTQNHRTDRETVEFTKKIHSLLATLHNLLSVQIPFQLVIKSGTQVQSTTDISNMQGKIFGVRYIRCSIYPLRRIYRIFTNSVRYIRFPL